MGSVVEVQAPPKTAMWKVVVDGRGLDPTEVIDWIRGSAKGRCVFMKTRFRDPKKAKQGWEHNRKRNFTDGYLIYEFWFAKKADAALCRMWWDFCREDS